MTLKQKYSETSRATEHWKEEYERCRQKEQVAQEQLRRVHTEIQTTIQKYQQLQARLITMENDIARHKEMEAAAQEQLRQNREQLHQHEALVVEKEARVAQANAESERLRQQIRAQTEQMEQNVRNMEAQIHTHRDEINRLKEREVKLNTDKQKVSLNLEQQTDEVTRLTGEFAELQAKLEDAQQLIRENELASAQKDSQREASPQRQAGAAGKRGTDEDDPNSDFNELSRSKVRSMIDLHNQLESMREYIRKLERRRQQEKANRIEKAETPGWQFWRR